MKVFENYTVTWGNGARAMVVGHLRTLTAPGPRMRIPLFDELTPNLLAVAPHPLCALVSTRDRADATPRWYLVPADLHPGAPATVRTLPDMHTAVLDTAVLGEIVYAALHLDDSEEVPVTVPVHTRCS